MEKIYKILDKLRPEINFKEASNFIEDDLLDSLDIIKLVVALEEEFSISIDTWLAQSHERAIIAPRET